MVRSDSPKQNHLLAALAPAEFERLSPHLERVAMPLGAVLYETGVRPDYVYFPTTSVVSLFRSEGNAAPAAVAIVGNEGILGITQLLVGEITPRRAMVQRAGAGYRLKAQLMQQEYNRAGPVLRLLLHYTQTLNIQMTQTVVCNRQHTLEQQLCRALLLSLDRQPADTAGMPQELAANPLGIPGGSETAAVLQRAGLIHHRHSHIEVLDRAGLQRMVCECYALIRDLIDRLLADMLLGDLHHSPAPYKS